MCENLISELIHDAAGVGDMTFMGTYERMTAYLWGHATCEARGQHEGDVSSCEDEGGEVDIITFSALSGLAGVVVSISK